MKKTAVNKKETSNIWKHGSFTNISGNSLWAELGSV